MALRWVYCVCGGKVNIFRCVRPQSLLRHAGWGIFGSRRYPGFPAILNAQYTISFASGQACLEKCSVQIFHSTISAILFQLTIEGRCRANSRMPKALPKISQMRLPHHRGVRYRCQTELTLLRHRASEPKIWCSR